VFVKLMSPKGPYDVASAKVTDSDIYFAEKEKEREMAATDRIFDHNLDVDVDRKKRIITAQSEYDFEHHTYD